MRYRKELFIVSTIILVCYLFARHMGWVGEITGQFADAKTARASEKLLAMPVCENAADFRSIRKFDVKRAYPRYAVRRGIEGRVKAMLRVDDAGKVQDVMITLAEPSGAFAVAVEREALKMAYEPAEEACQEKIREAQLFVEFKIMD